MLRDREVTPVGDLGRARLGAVQHAKEVGNFVVMVQQEIHPLLAHAAGARGNHERWPLDIRPVPGHLFTDGHLLLLSAAAGVFLKEKKLPAASSC
jgi:hypothetical protein